MKNSALICHFFGTIDLLLARLAQQLPITLSRGEADTLRIFRWPSQLHEVLQWVRDLRSRWVKLLVKNQGLHFLI